MKKISLKFIIRVVTFILLLVFLLTILYFEPQSLIRFISDNPLISGIVLVTLGFVSLIITILRKDYKKNIKDFLIIYLYTAQMLIFVVFWYWNGLLDFYQRSIFFCTALTEASILMIFVVLYFRKE